MNYLGGSDYEGERDTACAEHHVQPLNPLAMEQDPILPVIRDDETQTSVTTTESRPSLEKYLPWVRYADRVINTLHSLGLSKKQITEVLMGQDVRLTGEIVNPDDKKPLLISSVTVKILVKDGGASCIVLIDGKPIGAYFHDYYEREALLRDAADKSELVSKLYEENLEMRRILGGKARAYK